MTVTSDQILHITKQLTDDNEDALSLIMENDPQLLLDLIDVFKSLDPESLAILEALIKEEIELRNKK